MTSQMQAILKIAFSLGKMIIFIEAPTQHHLNHLDFSAFASCVSG